jgi:hypothetical protein
VPGEPRLGNTQRPGSTSETSVVYDLSEVIEAFQGLHFSSPSHIRSIFRTIRSNLPIYTVIVPPINLLFQ